MRGTGRYSTFVRWFKIGLPLAALALMSMIFLIDDDQIDLDLPPLSELSDGGRVTQSVINGDFTGRTETGEPYRLIASSAQQLADGLLLTAPRGRLDSASQGTITAISELGTYDADAQTLDLTGAVEFDVERGDVRLRSEDLRLGLANGSLSILAPLELTFEGGTLNANAARRAGNPPDDDTIWFEGDVRLFIDRTPLHSEN